MRKLESRSSVVPGQVVADMDCISKDALRVAVALAYLSGPGGVCCSSHGTLKALTGLVRESHPVGVVEVADAPMTERGDHEVSLCRGGFRDVNEQM